MRSDRDTQGFVTQLGFKNIQWHRWHNLPRKPAWLSLWGKICPLSPAWTSLVSIYASCQAPLWRACYSSLHPFPIGVGVLLGASKPSLLQSWYLLTLLQVLLATITDQVNGWPLLSWLPTRAQDLLPGTNPSPISSTADTLPAWDRVAHCSGPRSMGALSDPFFCLSRSLLMAALPSCIIDWSLQVGVVS